MKITTLALLIVSTFTSLAFAGKPSEVAIAGLYTGIPLEDALQSDAVRPARTFMVRIYAGWHNDKALHSLAEAKEAIKALPKSQKESELAVHSLVAWGPKSTLFGLPLARVVIKFAWDANTAQYRVVGLEAHLDKEFSNTKESIHAIEKELIAGIGQSEETEHLEIAAWTDDIGKLSLEEGSTPSIRFIANGTIEKYEVAFRNTEVARKLSAPTKSIFGNSNKIEPSPNHVQSTEVQEIPQEEAIALANENRKLGLTQNFGDLTITLPFLLHSDENDAKQTLEQFGENIQTHIAYLGENDIMHIKICETVYNANFAYDPWKGIKADMETLSGRMDNAGTPTYENGTTEGYLAQRATNAGNIGKTPVFADIISIQKGKTVWFILIIADNSDNQAKERTEQIFNTSSVN